MRIVNTLYPLTIFAKKLNHRCLIGSLITFLGVIEMLICLIVNPWLGFLEIFLGGEISLVPVLINPSGIV